MVKLKSSYRLSGVSGLDVEGYWDDEARKCPKVIDQVI
jgi:hypothetical protein